MLNATIITTTLSDSVARFFGNDVSTNRTSDVRKTMRAAFKEFAKQDVVWANSLFDKHFLTRHGEPTVVSYVNGSLSHREAAVGLANAWEEQLMPTNAKMRKVLRADVVTAAHRYLRYLPA